MFPLLFLLFLDILNSIPMFTSLLIFQIVSINKVLKMRLLFKYICISTIFMIREL